MLLADLVGAQAGIAPHVSLFRRVFSLAPQVLCRAEQIDDEWSVIKIHYRDLWSNLQRFWVDYQR